MKVYVNITKNTLCEQHPYSRIKWSFTSKPILPLLECVQINEIGWDIPIRWAKDNSNQWWKDNGHGHPLDKTQESPKDNPSNQYTEIKLP